MSREKFEAWMTDEQWFHGSDFEWDDSRNCYAQFGIHLSYKAWQAASKATEQQQTDSRSEITAAQELEKAREVTNCPQGVELQEHLKQLVAENLAIKSAAILLADESVQIYKRWNLTQQPDGDIVDMQTIHELLCACHETPATDSILREAEARGVDKAIEHLLTKFSCTGHVGVPAMALEYLAKQLREGKVE